MLAQKRVDLPCFLLGGSGLKFIAVDPGSSDFKGPYFHFEHHDILRPGCEFLDLRPVLKSHEKQWLDDLVNWHKEVSSVASKITNGWWYSQGSRLLANYPIVIQDFYISLAISDVVRLRNFDGIYLVGYSELVFQFLEEMGHDVVRTINRKSHWAFVFWKNTRNFISNTLTLLKMARSFRPSALKSLRPASVIIYSHIAGLAKDPAAGDHFYGEMFQGLPSLRDDEKLWLYYNDSRVPLTHDVIEGHSRRLGSRILILQEVVSPWIALQAICRAIFLHFQFKRLRHMIPPICIGGRSSGRAALVFYQEAIQRHWPMLEIAIGLVIRKLVYRTGARRVVYPYEEKPLERAINANVRRFEPTVKTIAVAHAIHNAVHLYLRNTSLVAAGCPEPVCVLTTGEGASRILESWAGMSKEMLIAVGSKRYCQPISGGILNRERGRNLRILVLAGLPDELPTLAAWVDQTPALFQGCELVIRKYPYSWHAEQDSGIERIKGAGVDVLQNSDSLHNQISNSDVVIFCASSSGFEAMLLGVFTIQCNLSSYISFTPLAYDFANGDAPSFSDPLMLRGLLSSVQNMSLDEYSAETSLQIRFARQIYSPVDKDKLAAVLAR